MKKILFILWIVFSYLSITAQILENEISNLGDANIVENEVLQHLNLTFINQVGNKNNTVVIQQNTAAFSNHIISEQRGLENNTFINQTGTSHATGLVQKGDFNDAQINSTGQLTSSVVNQSGDWNNVNLSIENKDDFLKVAQVLQTGNNNLVDLKITGSRFFWESDVKDAIIAQTGNNHSFSAVLDSYKSPIVVNQQAGPNGEGMKVDISTSDFYFPMK
jgi:minor curlin subunit